MALCRRPCLALEELVARDPTNAAAAELLARLTDATGTAAGAAAPCAAGSRRPAARKSGELERVAEAERERDLHPRVLREDVAVRVVVDLHPEVEVAAPARE